jgi:invasion protein IalB
MAPPVLLLRSSTGVGNLNWAAAELAVRAQTALADRRATPGQWQVECVLISNAVRCSGLNLILQDRLIPHFQNLQFALSRRRH